MKNKFSFLAIIVAVLCMGTADAQITPSMRKVLLTGNDRAILDKRISKYTAFTMDKKELTDNPVERSFAMPLTKIGRLYEKNRWRSFVNMSYVIILRTA
jgi:hypothetical protein